jgi:poly(A) polymerase
MASRKTGMTFHNHEQRGRQIAERICRRLKLSNADRERITWLVEYHQYLGEATRLRESKLKRILAMPGIEELIVLHRADAMASYGESPQVDYCERYLREEPTGPINPPPLVTGHDLVRHGMNPGAQFATILEQIREAQLDRLINSKREALEWIDRRLASQGPEEDQPPRRQERAGMREKMRGEMEGGGQ